MKYGESSCYLPHQPQRPIPEALSQLFYSNMITPLFSISQTEYTLILRIRAPHSRAKDIQLIADEHDFHFYTSPYLLHLCFEHPIRLDETPGTLPTHTKYDFEIGVATVTLQKLPPYPHFHRLDMLSTLLVTRPSNRMPPSIEVLSTSTEAQSEEDMKRLEIKTSAGINVPLRELTITRPRYGFATRYEGVFAVRADDVKQIVDLPQPDFTPVWRRAMLRRAAEDETFDVQHYMADWLLEEEFTYVLEWKYIPPQVSISMKNEWLDKMVKLPAREYLKDSDEAACADLGGLLFASCYDARITLGERCVESAWTVSKICASLSWLEPFKSVSEGIFVAFRRVLVYPLYRHYELAQLVLSDLRMLVEADVDVVRGRILRVLLELREIFENDSLLRLFCDLFLIDYCVWIQKVADDVLERFRGDVLAVKVHRQEIGWNLDNIEEEAVRMANGEVEEDGKKEEEIVREVAKVEVGEAAKGSGQVNAPLCCNGEIAISALSPYPREGLEMRPVETRKLMTVSDSSAKRKSSEAGLADSKPVRDVNEVWK